ncbi:DUF1801 domain-containing protein [Streptomyces sp. LX-29]|uniref:DUF1801 domain-containing protein n=1 Tax=Streptomyces sp. LX-29 TaxID=2900152 RepID=UPI00240D7346|nr:DUF1801 domain-containing protein [Streptomyces sp. LX-29]WFB10658.1 DUF1801 domain-containing protein [Streptomyces sp. LX-29]
MAKFATVDAYLASLPTAQREIADALLPLIEEALPGTGAVWHGHPVWSLGGAPGKSPVCYLKGYSAYLTFGFWRGQEVEDASGRLGAGARAMAAVKLRTLADVDAGLFADWLRQARELEGSAGA